MKATFEPLTRAEIHAHAVSNHEDENPAIYLGTYRKYNSGDLFGMWIDLTTFGNYEEFCDFCTRVHYDELDPEFMVQDFCNYPRSLYHESGLPTAQEFRQIQNLAALNKDEREAYSIYLDIYNEKADLEEFREHYVGKYESGEEFAEQLCEECGYFNNLPQWLQCCIDYSAVWRSLDTGGDYSEHDGHIFQ